MGSTNRCREGVTRHVFSSLLFLLVFLAGGVALATPTVSIDSPLANATISADNVTVSGTATGVGGGQGIDLVVVMDDSGSLVWEDPARARFNALQDLMNSFAAGANVQVGLIFFSDSTSTAVQLSDVSTAVASVNSAISSHAAPSGSTAIGSGITAAVAELAARGRTGASKVIVLFTDGEETMGSNPTGAATTAAAQGVTVNVVGLGTSGASSSNGAIATAGGGTLLAATDTTQLAGMFRSATLVGIQSVTVTNTTTGAAASNVSVSAGAFTAAIDLNDGANTIEVTATDTAGVTATQQVTVTSQGTTTTPPSRAVKLRPQVLMAGFDPMLIDITDTRLNIMAVVREGAAPIQSVNFSDNSGGFAIAMTLQGQLPNGDLVYSTTLTFQRGAAATLNFPNMFGSAQNEYRITVLDVTQQEHTFPAIQFGNNQDLTGTSGGTTAQAYNPSTCARMKPQVLMAGFDPTLIDFADTQFKVKAIVRPSASAAVQSVTLQQNSGSFAVAMQPESTLLNGDEIYSTTLTFARGAFPAGSFRDLWSSTMTGVFSIEVTDGYQQTHVFPELAGGNNQCL
ncbi:MAG: VWA domain-containing protein [Pseudomonadota bacterium]